MEPDHQIEQATDVLQRGGVVAYPSDTIYGLGAAISNDAAVRRVYELKGRDWQRPLLIAVADFEMLARYCVVTPREMDALRRLWPGAVSVLLPPRPNIPPSITAGWPSVGVRMPLHAPLQDLIRRVGEPITTTSANLSGRPDVTETEEVYLPVDFVMSGTCLWKRPSTLIDFAGRKIVHRGAEVERAEQWLASLPKNL